MRGNSRDVTVNKLTWGLVAFITLPFQARAALDLSSVRYQGGQDRLAPSHAMPAAAAAAKAPREVTALSQVVAESKETGLGSTVGDFATAALRRCLLLKSMAIERAYAAMSSGELQAQHQDLQSSVHPGDRIHHHRDDQLRVPGFLAFVPFIGGGAYLVLATIIAVLHHYCTVKHRRSLDLPLYKGIECELAEDQMQEGFNFGLFDSRGCTWRLAFCSYFCLCIQWPETVSHKHIKLMYFWPAFFLFVLLEVGSMTYAIAFPIWLIVMVYFRQKLRKRYDITHNTAVSMLEDCCAWGCCCWCASGQEMRQVECVMARGHEKHHDKGPEDD